VNSEAAIRAEQTTPGDIEPRVTLTLTELRGLLREAAAYERGHGAVVLDTRAEPFTTIAVDRPHVWPVAFMVSGCTGLAAAATAAATGNEFAILAFFAAVAVWGTATYQLVFNRKA
jgi:hypothetical protein